MTMWLDPAAPARRILKASSGLCAFALGMARRTEIALEDLGECLVFDDDQCIHAENARNRGRSGRDAEARDEAETGTDGEFTRHRDRAPHEFREAL